MSVFVSATVLGLVLAAAYAVISSGLVLTYATTGVFNFAQGSTGMLAAYTFWQLRVSWGWPTWLALLVTLGVCVPLAGLVIELLFRGLDGTSETTKLVVSVSLLFSMIGLANLIWPFGVSRTLPRFFGNHVVHVAGASPTWHDIVTIGVAVSVAAGLRLLLFRTRTGVAMRAVVDDPTLSRLNGVRASRVNQFSWILGTLLAAIGGILIAPNAGLDTVLLSTLIVNAYAAAIFGRLRSLSMTFVGAVVLGLADSYLQSYLPKSRYLAGLRLASPVIILFIALLLLPNPRLRSHVRLREYFPAPTRRGLATFAAVVLLGGLMMASTLSRIDLTIYGRIFSVGIIALSLVPLVGYANQVSLCQLSLAGIGAVAMAHYGHGGNPLGVVAAVAIAAAVGALVALPALRLSGIYLALATAAFAVALDRWIFTLPNFELGPWTIKVFEAGAASVDPLRFAGIDFGAPRSQFVLVVVAFVACTLLVAQLRRSRFGRRLMALRDSEAACATLGMSLVRTRVAVFALSAGIAGLGGALYGMQLTSVQGGNFDFTAGLPIFMLVAIGGAGFVSAALFTGVVQWGFFPASSAFFGWFTRYQPVTTGLAGVGLGREPSGAAPEFRAGNAAFVENERVKWATLALMVLWWLGRLAGAYGNWPFAIGLVVIFLAGSGWALGAAQRERRSVRGKGRREPLEWVGVAEPWTPERLAEVDRALALEEFAVEAGPR